MPDIPQTLDAAVDRGPEPSGRRRFAAFLSRHGPLVLTLAPLAWLIWVIGKYSVEVPCMDQWELVPLLDKMYRGGLTLHDLWAQHNEHRIFFPYIIMLGLARLTGWNIRCEMAVNVLLAAGILVILVRQTNKTARKLGMTRLPWAMPALSLVVFSITQYQNWLWGWQIQMLLNLLVVLGGIVVLAGEPFGWRRFAAAALLGIVASFSFANGVLFWPIGLFLLLAVPIGGRQRMAAIAGWLLISALTVGAYFHHYRSSEGHPPWDCLFHQPLTYVAYLLKYFGNFFGQHGVGDIPTDGDIALAAGLVGIMAMGWAAGVLLRGKIADFRTLLPYFAMSLYSVITALVTGVGRLGFGSDEATFSRYCTMMVPFWASLVIFLFLLAQVPPRGRRRVHRRRWFRAGATRLKPVVVARQMVGRWSLRAALAFL
ncbi:MAG: hypothetical protein ACLP7I_18960, partial [Limisphaerales bacterium]